MAFSQSWLVVGIFLAILVALPALVKWLKDKHVFRSGASLDQVRVVSAVGVGPHQRVVVVEVGSAGSRTRLTLGVTPQNISFLHSTPVEPDFGATQPGGMP